MLDYLGVPYIQSAGEAEAMCAFLNKNHVSATLSGSFYFILLELFFKYAFIHGRAGAAAHIEKCCGHMW